MAPRKKLKTTFKVVEYRGGRICKRSKVTIPVQITVPGGPSVSDQPSSNSDVSELHVNEIEDDGSGIGFTNENNMEDNEVNEIAQYGKQSLMKTRVRQYRKRKEAEIEAWSSIRQSILDKYIESMALDRDSSCSFCSNKAEYRCSDCGILKVMCAECCVTIHKNSLHVPEIWKGDGFEVFTFNRDVWENSNHDSDLFGYIEEITVVNVSGVQIKACVMFYHQEEPCLTLIGYGMWPATPKEPKVAFDIRLLELAEVLFLECRLSTKQFCNALKWLVPDLSQAYVKDIYRLLVGECFSEFRFMRYQFRTLKQFNPQLINDGTICPACPKESGTVHMSVDALFGCVRKKSSGKSTAPPKHGETFFVGQDKVDLFTSSYGKKKETKLETECNQFQAGTNLRSKVKSNKLDETAVFGCSCRHEVPNTFFSLKRGEQISNAVFLLQHLKQKTQPSVKLNFMYDIACTLDSHLKASGQVDLLDDVNLAIPVFHVYGHKVKCQISYSPRRLKGFGMTDGEVMERLWSYLRPTGNITKEMTASHRIHALTDYLLHYTRKSVSQIGDLLCQRMQKTLQLQKCSNEELNLLSSKLGKDGE